MKKLDMTARFPLIAEAITEQWGDRCPDIAIGCPCCGAWAEFDELTACYQREKYKEERYK